MTNSCTEVVRTLYVVERVLVAVPQLHACSNSLLIAWTDQTTTMVKQLA
jgi:hypothetical protein